MTFDSFSAHPPRELKARGLPVVHELVKAVHARAERVGEDFTEACARLSKPWQATMLLAYVLERFERDESIPEIVRDLAEVDDRTLLLSALREIRELPLAKRFQEAEDVLDEDPRTAWNQLGPPEPAELVRLHKKIFALVAGMEEPFPAAE